MRNFTVVVPCPKCGQRLDVIIDLDMPKEQREQDKRDALNDHYRNDCPK